MKRNKFLYKILFFLFLSMSSQVTLALEENTSNLNPIVYLPYLSHIFIQNYPSVAYEDIFQRSKILSANPRNYDEFYQQSELIFEQNKDYLESKWHLNNDILLKTIFFMNLASNFWDYGDVKRNKGCNKYRHNAEQHFEEYLNYGIGCCNDFTAILAVLLEHAGINHRITSFPGHVFVEVKINGRWMVFDPTSNIMVHESWQNVNKIKAPLNRPSKVDLQKIKHPIIVSIFPNHSNVFQGNESHYRSIIGSFQTFILLKLLDKSKHPVKHRDKAWLDETANLQLHYSIEAITKD